MFKPSLRKSILNDNLCLESQQKHNIFESISQTKQQPVYNKVLLPEQSQQRVNLPSMMTPQRLLSQTTIVMDHNPDTRVFTPFTYDFVGYPRAVREFIAHNPKAAQAGKCEQINFVIFEKCLFLWTLNNTINNHKQFNNTSLSPTSPSQTTQPHPLLLKMHKFPQQIDIAQFSTITNTRIFTISKAIVLCIVFKNRMKLFMINRKQLSLQDMMVKYQLKGASKIHCVHFTKYNEIIFAGDNGKLSMLSLNNTNNSTSHPSTIPISQQPNLLSRYLSTSSFDYSTRYNIREITSCDKFIYCLYDRIKRANYLMYLLKRMVNGVVGLEEEPKLIVDQGFVDVYEVIGDNSNININKTNNNKEDIINQRKSIKLVDRIAQHVLQQRVKQGYNTFTGEGVRDGFRMVGVRAKLIDSNRVLSSPSRINNNNINISINVFNPAIQIITKCGYIISIVHNTLHTLTTLAANDNISINNNKQQQSTIINNNNNNNNSTQKSQQQQQQLSFIHQPIKLPSMIGSAHFLQTKIINASLINGQKSLCRKNHVIKCISTTASIQSSNELVLLMTDSIMRVSADGMQISVIRFNDLKVRVQQTTINKQHYVTVDQFNNKYNHYKNKYINNNINNNKSSNQQQSLSQKHNLFPNSKTLKTTQHKYYRLFNSQRRFTAFDNQGEINIYLLQLRHVIIAYISYYLQTTYKKNNGHHNNNQTSSSFSMLNGVVEHEIKLQKILQKIVLTYGYCKVLKSLIQILTLNNNNNRQYIYFQRNLFIDIIRKQFQQQSSYDNNSGCVFQQWNYSLSDHQQSKQVVCSDGVMGYVWGLVCRWGLRQTLSKEVVRNHVGLVNMQGGYGCNNQQWADQLISKQRYSAYGNALLKLFNKQFNKLSSIPIKQYKLKQQDIHKCQSNLIKLYEFINQKSKQVLKYKQQQLSNQALRVTINNNNDSSSNKKYQYQHKQQYQYQPIIKTNDNNILNNNNNKSNQQQVTFYTTILNKSQTSTIDNINNKSSSISPISISSFSITQSNSILQQSLLRSIQKIVTLVDVMNLLIEKDQRTKGVPTFIQVLTTYKGQLRCGELLFQEEYIMGDSSSINNNNNNTITFIHPQLVQRVLRTLPQLQMDKKIQFLKFKLARNIVPSILGAPTVSTVNNDQHHIDLKSLDLYRLAKITSSINLMQLSSIFMSSQQSSPVLLTKAQFYMKFLTICLTSLISRVNQIINIKQLKFNNLSQDVKITNLLLQKQQQQSPSSSQRTIIGNSSNSLLIGNYNVQRLLLAEQKLAYYQSEMKAYYDEVVRVFNKCVGYLAKVTGTEYYQAQRYLQRIIELLVGTFPNEQVLIQTIKAILKSANMLDKVQFVRIARKKKQACTDKERIFVDLSMESQGKIQQRSTFQYLLNRNSNNDKNRQNNHNNINDRTVDTWRNNNTEQSGQDVMGYHKKSSM